MLQRSFRILRRIYPDCKILLFSVIAATTLMIETATRTVHNFVLLNKPVHPSEILSRIADSVLLRRGATAGNGQAAGPASVVTCCLRP